MIKNFFNVAGADAVKRIAEWIRHKFYTKTEIDEMFSAGAKYKVVNVLPSTGVEGTIYLVPSSTSPSGDIYDEYIYVDGDFEKIGTTKADLANVVRVPTAGTAVGDTTHPVYVDADGEATAGSQYAGGTKLTLNGTDKGADSATAYAPTAGGTAGQYLKSNGSGNAPSWETMDTAPTANSTKAVTSGGVKTALDGKQASISITTKTDDAGDNDKVILQANGVTDTTTFVRRSLSNLLNWFRSKLDEVYVPFGWIAMNEVLGMTPRLYNTKLDDVLWGADKRYDVTWKVYDGTTHEQLYDKSEYIPSLFDGTFSGLLAHPVTGEYEVLTIQPKDNDGSQTLRTYWQGTLILYFYYTHAPNEAPTCRIKQRNSNTWTTLTATKLRGSAYKINLTVTPTWYYLNTLEITIQGKTDTTEGGGTALRGLVWIPSRYTYAESSVVTKYAQSQSLYGNITAPKFITRGGTTSQFVLGDGTLQNSPIPVSKGGTGGTSATAAEYNILSKANTYLAGDVTDDSWRIPYISGVPSTSNGRIIGYKLPSQLWTYIKGKISTVLGIQEGTIDGKVNLQPDFTASQIDYSAGNVGKWQKVLRFPEGADLVINTKKTAMGSDSTSTLWFSSSSMGDSYTSLFGNHSVRFVHDGGYVFLVIACRKSTYEPIESYTFQIAHSSVPMSDIVAVTEASPITATPNEPNIVYRAPMTTGAVSFNVTSGAGSVSMSGHNDFLGNMTSEATNGVVVTMSGATEGQIYRFVFTRNITGGVTFKQSNVAYCTISGDVNAGDTITLTAVSNTADGWLYEQESAGIKSTDGSVNVEYDGGVADLSINIPPDVVRNNVWTSSLGHRVLAIGDGASADTSSNNVAIGKEADASGNFAVCVGGNSEASDGGSCAYGYQAKAGGGYSTAVGYQAKCEAYCGLSLGEFSRSIGNYSVAVGGSAKAGIPSTDTDRPRLSVKEFIAVQFSEGGNSKISEYVTTTDAVTITVNGNDYTLTPPAANRVLIVVYDSNAQYITEAVTGYAKVNGEDLYMVSDINIEKENLSGNYYALWLIVPSAYYPSNVTSLSILAYHKSANTTDYAHAIGYRSMVSSSNSVAMGNDLVSVTARQTVIGVNNIPDIDAFFVVGAGSTAANGRKNILTIDSKERLRVRSYVGETQTIDMSQQTGSLSNITKAVYRIRWNDTGTVNLTLDTGGCVEGQRVTIFAETNDVQIRFTSFLIPEGRFADFMFIAGAWRPYSGIGEVPTA